MEPDEREARIEVSLRSGRTVAFSAFLGLGIFYAICAYLLQANPPPPETPLRPYLPFVALALALAGFLLSLAIRASSLAQAKRATRGVREPLGILLARYRMGTLMAIAFCTAGGFLHAALTLAAGPEHINWLAGGLLPALGLAIHFPTRQAIDGLLADAGKDPQDSVSSAP
jgi:hypothetical protein